MSCEPLHHFAFEKEYNPPHAIARSHRSPQHLQDAESHCAAGGRDGGVCHVACRERVFELQGIWGFTLRVACRALVDARLAVGLSDQRGVRAMVFTLPWGIAEDFKWWTIPLTMVISYFMIGMEIVAEHVEEPFGFDEDDLDLDGMCKTIEASVKELFRPCVGGDA